MSKTIKMLGLTEEYFALVRETMTVSNAFEEFIDNSIDSGAKNIIVEIDKDRNCGIIRDDGCGMSEKKVYKFVGEFCVHMPTKEVTIGCHGAGAKNASIRVSDPIKGSRVAMNTWENTEVVTKVLFRVANGNENEFLYPIVCQENPKKWTEMYGEHGTMWTIENLSPDVSSNHKWKSNLIKSLSKKYSHLLAVNKINITIDGEKVECEDRTHLAMLGDDVKNAGVYIKNGKYHFIVKKYSLRNNFDATDNRVLTVVYHYFNEEENKPKDAYKDAFYGMYSIYNGRFLQVPYSGNTYLPFSKSQTGGVCRTSATIFVEGNEDILGLKKNKSEGIDITARNVKLENYTVVNTDNKTFREIFKIDYNRLINVAKFQSTDVGPGHDKSKYRNLSVDVIKRIIKGESLIALKREYDEKKGENVLPPVSSSTFSSEDEQEILASVISRGDDETLLAEMESAPKVKYVTCKKNKETGGIDYSFTENIPEGVNKDIAYKICGVVSNGKYKMSKNNIEEMCTEIIDVLKAF